MQSNRQALVTAAVATLAIHVLLAGGLYAAGNLALLAEDRPIPIEVEIIEPPPPKPRPKPKPPPRRAEPEKPPEPEKPKPRDRRKRVAKAQPPPRAAPPPAPPAPGPVSNSDVPAPVVSMPDLGVGATGPAVKRGRPTSRKVGTGGTGTNTGGGGKPDSTGTGGPRPVSIAAIKTRAKPLNPDLDVARFYPAGARRLGIEGKVKVKLVVDEKGRVASRRLLNKIGYGLDQAALKVVELLRFEPARDTDDRTVSSTVIWTVTFVLPK